MDKDVEREAATHLVGAIDELGRKVGVPVRLMEVCGTHTMTIFRSGIRQLLPPNVELVSGPGCPVCVTADDFIDKAVAYAQEPGTIIATFGDMLKVPGTCGSLAAASAQGANVQVVYSPLEAISIARENPRKRVIFLSVGFETTTPAIAAVVKTAAEEGIGNLFFLSAPKLVPPVMRFLLDDKTTRIDGFILPGHVAVIVGAAAFDFVAKEYELPCVVAGFEPLSILRAVYRLLAQIYSGEATLVNEYKSVVSDGGNVNARQVMESVYEPCTATWRGMGEITASGLRLKGKWRNYDIEYKDPLDVKPSTLAANGCRCGEVLRGVITPPECPLFAKACVPNAAVGSCMVSSEGVCAAWYKYGQGRFSHVR